MPGIDTIYRNMLPATNFHAYGRPGSFRQACINMGTFSKAIFCRQFFLNSSLWNLIAVCWWIIANKLWHIAFFNPRQVWALCTPAVVKHSWLIMVTVAPNHPTRPKTETAEFEQHNVIENWIIHWLFMRNHPRKASTTSSTCSPYNATRITSSTCVIAVIAIKHNTHMW